MADTGGKPAKKGLGCWVWGLIVLGATGVLPTIAFRLLAVSAINYPKAHHLDDKPVAGPSPAEPARN